MESANRRGAQGADVWGEPVKVRWSPEGGAAGATGNGEWGNQRASRERRSRKIGLPFSQESSKLLLLGTVPGTFANHIALLTGLT